MDQLGHENAAFTLRVYRHGMRRDAESRQAVGRLVGINADEANDLEHRKQEANA
jgi:hypothetical protein